METETRQPKRNVALVAHHNRPRKAPQSCLDVETGPDTRKSLSYCLLTHSFDRVNDLAPAEHSGEYCAGLVKYPGSECDVAGNRTHLEERLDFPKPCGAPIILQESRFRRHQRAGVPVGTQTQIDPIGVHFFGVLREIRSELFHYSAIELLRVSDRRFFRWTRCVVVKDRHEIEIRAVIQLGATQFAQGQDTKGIEEQFGRDR